MLKRHKEVYIWSYSLLCIFKSDKTCDNTVDIPKWANTKVLIEENWKENREVDHAFSADFVIVHIMIIDFKNFLFTFL